MVRYPSLHTPLIGQFSRGLFTTLPFLSCLPLISYQPRELLFASLNDSVGVSYQL